MWKHAIIALHDRSVCRNVVVKFVAADYGQAPAFIQELQTVQLQTLN